MAKCTKRKIEFDGQSYGERELAQVIRRKMMTKEYKSSKVYCRKDKHKQRYEPT